MISCIKNLFSSTFFRWNHMIMDHNNRAFATVAIVRGILPPRKARPDSRFLEWGIFKIFHSTIFYIFYMCVTSGVNSHAPSNRRWRRKEIEKVWRILPPRKARPLPLKYPTDGESEPSDGRRYAKKPEIRICLPLQLFNDVQPSHLLICWERLSTSNFSTFVSWHLLVNYQRSTRTNRDWNSLFTNGTLVNYVFLKALIIIH